MKRTTIFLDEGTERELQAMARRTRRPMASIVREALERYVVENRTGPGARLGFVAAGASGRSDTADRHEEFLFQESTAPPAAEVSAAAPKRTARALPTGRSRARSAREKR